MADYTITPANVRPNGKTTLLEQVQFGEIVDEGEAVYKKTSDGKYWLCDADLSVDASICKGIAVIGGAADAWGYIAKNGPITFGGTGTQGAVVIVSDTAGGLKPIGDLTAGDYITIVGVLTTTTELDLSIKPFQVAKT